MKYVWLVVVFMCSVQGCKVEYFGPNCSKPCVYPGFGELCQEVCKCTQDKCNAITGCADCNVGYHGSHCTKPCRYPNFGIQCQEKCNCTEDICNHIMGCINIPGSNDIQTTSNSAPECEDGYIGQDCISPCRYPNYGRKCQNECKCFLSECNHIKGCGGWTGNFLSKTTENNKYSTKSREQIGLEWKQFITIAGWAAASVAKPNDVQGCSQRRLTQVAQTPQHNSDSSATST